MTDKEKKKPVRAKGEGTLYRWNDGWAAQIDVTNGGPKRKRRTVYGKTRIEVAEKLADIRSQFVAGTLPEPSRETVEHWVSKYVEHLSNSGRINRGTKVNYDRSVKNDIVPGIGWMSIQKVAPSHIEEFLASLSTHSSRELAYNVLQPAFEKAVKFGVLKINPVSAVDRPRRPKRLQKTFTVAHVQKIFATAHGTHYYPLIVTAALTGMRLGELFGLQWDDVDFDNETILVRHCLEDVEASLELQDRAKTDSSLRTINAPAIVLDVLNWLRADQVKRRPSRMRKGTSGYVFTTPSSTMIRRANWSKKWKSILEEAEVPHIKFHALRHTMATLMMSAKVPVKVVQERLGHSSVTTTLGVYSHVMPGMQADAANLLEAMFQRRGDEENTDVG